MSDSVRPQRRQPTRLPCPWDSPGKNTGVACHFLLQCMKVKSESEVAQSCPTPRDPTDCKLPGSSVSGIFQARVLEWGAIALEYQQLGQYWQQDGSLRRTDLAPLRSTPTWGGRCHGSWGRWWKRLGEQGRNGGGAVVSRSS